MPPQWVTTEPALMEGVERMNAVILHPQQREGVTQRNPYVMEVDKERNCYTCGGFRHMAQHCKNKGGRIRIGDSRRLEYRQRWRREENFEQSDNLKEEENLESLN